MTAPIVFGPSGQGLTPLINALQFRKQEQQRQQQLELQQQQVELQEVSQRTTQRNQAINRMVSLMEVFGEDVLEDELVAQGVEEAGLNPATLLKRFRERQKEQQQIATERQKAVLQTLPQRLRPATQVSLGLLEQGFPAEQVSQTFRLMAEEAVDEELLATIDSEMPDLAGLPTPDKIEAFVSIRTLQAEAAQRVGPEADRQHQRQIRDANLAIARERLALTRGSETDKLRAASTILDIINESVSLIALSLAGRLDLMGLSRNERVERIFGKSMLDIERRAIETLGASLPQP